MRPTVLFDDGKGLLSPLTDLRPAFDIRTGAFTMLERCPRLGLEPVVLVVPERLAAVTAERHALPVNTPVAGSDPIVLLNGRWAAPGAEASSLQPGEAIVEEESGDLLAACVEASRAGRVLGGDLDGLRPTALQGRRLLSRPWHVRTFRDAVLDADLAWLIAERGGRREEGAAGGGGGGGGYRAIAAPSARVHPTAVLDTERGHIAIDEEAVIRPMAIISGPAYIGPHTTVLDRAIIKAGTALGPHCKVAGEVGGTIFQGFANKAHDGHLGDSWVGEWANLGAGTTNSNLLNTYAEVICRGFGPDGSPGPNERTGEQFLGCIIGDHCKFAICTRIMTGAIIGTGTMWAATAAVSGCVPAFTWATDGGMRRYRLDKFVEVAQAAMSRRKVEPSRAYLEVVAALHQGVAGGGEK